MPIHLDQGGGSSSGGMQYPAGSTGMGTTGTGTLVIGIQSGATTGRALLLTTTGNLITVISTVLGTVAVSGGGGGVQYPVNDTSMAATGTGTLIIGMQSGATTARGIAVTATGAQYSVIQTGTVNVVAMPVLSATNVTIASITTGTMSVINVLSASGVTVAAVTTGTFTLAGTGNVTIAGTPTVTATYATVPAFIQINYSTQWNSYVVATTSAAAGVIVKTSGAHTLYVTDLIVAATTPNGVQLCSETTAMAQVYLATQGGFIYNARTPVVCTTAQSFRVVLASSGSVSVFAAGYTVT